MEYTYCGLDCNNCEYKEKFDCKGCRETYGNPFHGECRLAMCAISQSVEHCGLCNLFPCNLLKEFSYDKEHGDNGERIKNLEKVVNLNKIES